MVANYLFRNIGWKTKKYLKEKRHKVLLGVKGFIIERDLKNRFLRFLGYMVDIALTGLVLAYIINNWPNWISLGLLSGVIVYYLGNGWKAFVKGLKEIFKVLKK